MMKATHVLLSIILKPHLVLALAILSLARQIMWSAVQSGNTTLKVVATVVCRPMLRFGTWLANIGGEDA